MRAARGHALTLAMALVGASAGLAPRTAHAEDELAGASIIFARGAALYRTDARGKGEAQVATLPTKVAVRALRTDAQGTVLLADLGGKWSWMPLDGQATALTPLPCGDGPAQLATDGACVLCRSARTPTGSVIVHLASGKVTPVAIPAAGARLLGEGAGRRLVWADAEGVWSAPLSDLRTRTQLARQAPLRSFLPTPDGTRAVGVFVDTIFTSARESKPGEVLMTFALDGVAARRKSIKAGVPILWSHDSQWLLLQDRGSACIARALGGQYKCWKGYTGASLAADGRWALVLGARSQVDSKSDKKSDKKSGKKADKKAGKKAGKKSDTKADRTSGKNADGKAGETAAPEEAAPVEAAAPTEGLAGEPSNEAENREGMEAATDDVEVAPPSGPLALYRAKLEGPFTEAPVLVLKVVDGAVVWVPARRPAP